MISTDLALKKYTFCILSSAANESQMLSEDVHKTSNIAHVYIVCRAGNYAKERIQNIKRNSTFVSP